MNIFRSVQHRAELFTNADLVGSNSTWVGVLNYKFVFKFAKYGQALRTTALFVFLAVACELLLGFGLAYAAEPLCSQAPGPNGAARAHDVTPGGYGAVLEAYSQRQLRRVKPICRRPYRFFAAAVDNGSRSQVFFRAHGRRVDVDALHDAHISGCSASHPHIYEAAAIDRASPWRTFRRITLPMCAPLLGLAVLLRATDALKQFDLIMALTGPNDRVTQTLSALLYQTVFRDGKVGLGDRLFVRHTRACNRVGWRISALYGATAAGERFLRGLRFLLLAFICVSGRCPCSGWA